MKPDILVIDDDQWMAEHMARVLGVEGYAVRIVPHAYAAIAAIDERIPQVIILDIILPGTNGIALLHELQSYVDTARIPIIVATHSIGKFSPSILYPYGVRRLLDKTTIIPADIVAAVCEVSRANN